MKTWLLILLLLTTVPLVTGGIEIGDSVDKDSNVIDLADSEDILTFLGLTDTPATYEGSGTECVKVNAGATALEFGACGGGAGDYNYNETLVGDERFLKLDTSNDPLTSDLRITSSSTTTDLNISTDDFTKKIIMRVFNFGIFTIGNLPTMFTEDVAIIGNFSVLGGIDANNISATTNITAGDWFLGKINHSDIQNDPFNYNQSLHNIFNQLLNTTDNVLFNSLITKKNVSSELVFESEPHVKFDFIRQSDADDVFSKN